MGQSLIKLWEQLGNLEDSNRSRQAQILQLLPTAKDNAQGLGCNYAIAFGLVAASLAIAPEQIATGYIYSWAANLISAAVRSVPLGQTVGQQVNFILGDDVVRSAKTAQEMALLLAEDFDKQENARQLEWCGWGVSIASTNHEVQYSRLFRS
jgi:urease accessory protein